MVSLHTAQRITSYSIKAARWISNLRDSLPFEAERAYWTTVLQHLAATEERYREIHRNKSRGTHERTRQA